jgi:hypothetical protein
MLDKSKLGNRWVCFECETKFYDMAREVPTCPECHVDQREAPVRDIKSLLSSKGKPALTPIPVDEPEVKETDVDLDEDEDDDDGAEDLGLSEGADDNE